MTTFSPIGIVVGLYFCHFCFGLKIRATEKTELRNRFLVDNIIPNTETPISLVDCFRVCTKTQTCMSISYQERTDVCNMYSHLKENDLGIYVDGWKTYLYGDLTLEKDNATEANQGETTQSYTDWTTAGATTESNTGETNQTQTEGATKGTTTESTTGETTPGNLADTCPTSSGYIYHSGLQICYKIHFGEYTYSTAVAGCAAESSTLIKINNADKLSEVANTLYTLFTTHNTGSLYAYIQGTRDVGKTDWYFDDGTQMTYTRWGASQPDNRIGVSIDYISMTAYLTDGWYYDIKDTFQISYICER